MTENQGIRGKKITNYCKNNRINNNTKHFHVKLEEKIV